MDRREKRQRQSGTAIFVTVGVAAFIYWAWVNGLTHIDLYMSWREAFRDLPIVEDETGLVD
jgi:hypothetical protein